MRNRPDRRISELCVALLLGAIFFQLTSCGRSSAGAAEPTAPEVEVVTVEQKDIPVYREWIGTLDGMVNAAIRAQVTGYLLPRLFGRLFRQEGPVAFPDRSAPTSSCGGPGAGTTRPGERPVGAGSRTISAI